MEMLIGFPSSSSWIGRFVDQGLGKCMLSLVKIIRALSTQSTMERSGGLGVYANKSILHLPQRNRKEQLTLSETAYLE